ncbi:MAG: Tim44 domain-containing protein [Duodenibacillus sp.]|nr:Tim44 domain-containing protein [Duodenibacillus sp.]
MKKLLAVVFIGLTLACASTADAARRLGGGGTFGKPASSLFQSAPKSAAAPKAAPKAAPGQQQAARPTGAGAAAAAAKPASPWRGILMGAATALGLTWLMHALGLSGEFAQILMILLIAGAVYFGGKMLLGGLLAKKQGASRRSAAPAWQQSAPRREEAPSWQQPASAQPASAGSVMDVFSGGGAQPELSIPAGFDCRGFEAVAKEQFARLQKAWDTGSVLEISDFTTSEFFTEVTHQMRARGNVRQSTEMIDVSAKLEGFADQGDSHYAVVRFTGAMKISGEFEELDERWVLVRERNSSDGWLLAGIEQVA